MSIGHGENGHNRYAVSSNQFDCIICYHVLEHIPDDQMAMKEIFRVLKPGGWAILQVPILRDKTFEDPSVITPEDRERVFGQRDHVRIYGLDYKDRLEQAGFSVKVDDYVKQLSSDVIERYGLMKDENIYFCSKPNLEGK
ncbi:methyltransferase domain-containing protein [Acetomicrobium sp.]|uniref:methyltransferase domain-containing protein n=1 Tax=Acetomicrobium sp. TaxID=1872099 RepID=UPI002FC93DAE